MNRNGYMNCELCNKEEFEKSIQQQNGHYLCFDCNGRHDDQELESEIKKREEELQ